MVFSLSVIYYAFVVSPKHRATEVRGTHGVFILNVRHKGNRDGFIS